MIKNTVGKKERPAYQNTFQKNTMKLFVLLHATCHFLRSSEFRSTSSKVHQIVIQGRPCHQL